MGEVWSFLRTKPVTGDYPVPASEAAYLGNWCLYDAALPMNGGHVQPDGSWLQYPTMTDTAWARALPEQAAPTHQKYMPVVGNASEADICAVLDNAGVQATAADNLVTLAGTTRFDAPWEGVYLDIEHVPLTYQAKLSTFLELLSDHIRDELGATVGASVRGRVADSGDENDKVYAYDFSVLAEIADVIDIRCYGYTVPAPQAIGPEWWLRACIEYALGKGIEASQLNLGLGICSRYWPVEDAATSYFITNEQARQMATDAAASWQWIETNDNGSACEWYADLGAGCVWLHDGEVIQRGLDLIDEYNLRGVALFCPGMGEQSIWQAIASWRQAAAIRNANDPLPIRYGPQCCPVPRERCGRD